MLRDGNLAVEHAAARDLFEQLRPTNEQISGVTARIESFHEQLEKLWIHHEQLEEHAAQAVRFHEADELIERHVRIGRAREPAK